MKFRPFNSFQIVDDKFIKLSQSDRLADEIFYYYSIQKFPQKNLFAEFYGDVSDGNSYALVLKNYQHKNLYENFKNNSKLINLQIIDNLLECLSSLHSGLPPNYNDSNSFNKKILIEKTENEFEIFNKQSNILMNHFKNKSIININGVNCLHFDKIWGQIKSIIISNYLHADLSLIHGDFCFANILLNDENQFILIDPRGSYHLRGCFGDKAYDYAKLLHSFHGNYEQIIYDDYKLLLEKDKVSYTFNLDFTIFQDYLSKKLDPLLFRKSKLIEGLLFISMCSRHYDNEEHQFIMYCQGLLILNSIYKESIHDLNPLITKSAC